MLNMVALGALLSQLPVLSLEAVQAALKNHLPQRHQHLLPVNYQALQRGAEFALKEAVPASLV